MNNNTLLYIFSVFFVILLLAATYVSFENINARQNLLDTQMASLQGRLHSFVAVKMIPKDSTSSEECVEGESCDLQRGSSGENVKVLQMFLKKYPEIYPEGAVNGLYDGYTESAVKRLQMQCDIKPNGKISPQVVQIMKDVYICDVLDVCGTLVVKRGVLTVGPCPPILESD